MADQSPKQQIVDKLRDVDTVMVTVNSNPSVDELSAALGFTLLLNKLNKHATAIFSGEIPPAITFLDPEKTFENTADSLRDFIIALDKEKADHLRYKLDGDMVKIFITPYRTTITDQDLEFSQGDYNVEMVVALGVRDEQDLDRALSEHGRILHNATVVSISNGTDSSDLGSFNWHDSEASSYSEMLVNMSEALRSDKKLIDEQIATAFLTGIVAATDRFSNTRTSSKVMTMAAELMAAGANQQLIATKLEEAEEIAPPPRKDDKSSDDDQPQQPSKDQPDEPASDGSFDDDGTMRITHEKKGDLDDVAAQTALESQKAAAQKADDALRAALKPEDDDAELAATLTAGAEQSRSAATPSIDDLKKDLEAAKDDMDEAAAPLPPSPDMSLPSPANQFEPSMGGTLNATTDQAAEDKRREEESSRNKQMLTHDHGAGQYVGNPPSTLPALNSFSEEPPQPHLTELIATEEPSEVTAHAPTINPLPPLPPLPPVVPEQTLAELDAKVRMTPHDAARSEIEAALMGSSTPDPQPAPMMADPMMPPQQFVGAPPALDDTSLPPLPPMPDFSSLPPMPGAQPQANPDPNAALDGMITPPQDLPGAPQQPASNDPAQFQLPQQF